jgi:hypothetical protein
MGAYRCSWLYAHSYREAWQAYFPQSWEYQEAKNNRDKIRHPVHGIFLQKNSFSPLPLNAIQPKIKDTDNITQIFSKNKRRKYFFAIFLLTAAALPNFPAPK